MRSVVKEMGFCHQWQGMEGMVDLEVGHRAWWEVGKSRCQPEFEKKAWEGAIICMLREREKNGRRRREGGKKEGNFVHGLWACGKKK